MATGWLSVIANTGLAVQPQSAVPQGAGRKVHRKVVFPGKHRNALGMIGVFVRYKQGFYVLHRQLQPVMRFSTSRHDMPASISTASVPLPT
jgi:hypothetical protein